MSVELKIKSKHLAIEPKIIRFEERKLKKQIRYEIRMGGIDSQKVYELISKLNSVVVHRKEPLREESRATHLARMYLMNKPYVIVENSRKPEKEYAFKTRVLKRVHAMVVKYGNPQIRYEDIENWVK